MKVGHRQAPNKRKPDSKESGFFAFVAVSQVGWVEIIGLPQPPRVGLTFKLADQNVMGVHYE